MMKQKNSASARVTGVLGFKLLSFYILKVGTSISVLNLMQFKNRATFVLFLSSFYGKELT